MEEEAAKTPSKDCKTWMQRPGVPGDLEARKNRKCPEQAWVDGPGGALQRWLSCKWLLNCVRAPPIHHPNSVAADKLGTGGFRLEAQL